MTRARFPLFQSHLDLAHEYWRRIVKPGDTVIDATCGNGVDTLMLAQLALNEASGSLYVFDIQAEALAQTRQRLKHLTPQEQERVVILHQCHSKFPESIANGTVRLIVYNLGYLPGGDKAVTTCMETTLQSISRALPLLCSGGCLSITVYPGHVQGAEEERGLLPMLQALDPKLWSCCCHRWINRGDTSPGLILVQAKEGT